MKRSLLLAYERMIRGFSGYGLVRLRPIRVLHSFFLARLKTRYAEVLGHRMYLDRVDTLRLSLNGVWEPYETQVLTGGVQAGDVVFDIGANIGYYTLLLARSTGAAGHVYAFEPEPENFRLLEKNIAANGYQNVTAFNKAVGETSATRKLYLHEFNKGDHRMYESGDGRKHIPVECVSLDELLGGQNVRPDWIKMDVQGAEGLVLQGMREILGSGGRLKLLTEFWPYALDRAGSRPEEFLRTLLDYGFSLHELDERREETRPVTDVDLLRRYTVENTEQGNLICIRD